MHMYVCVCVRVCGEGGQGCVNKWRGKEEGQVAAAVSLGEWATAWTLWPWPHQSIILTEMPQVWPDPREVGRNPSQTPGKPGAAWTSLPQALGGLAWGQPVTVWLGTS